MEIAERERVRFGNGIEYPIECHYNHGRPRNQKPHYHKYIEFLYAVGECDVDVWIAGSSVRFQTGDMLIINSDVAHSFNGNVDVSVYICIKVLPSIIYSDDAGFSDIRYVIPFFHNSTASYRFYPSEDNSGDDELRSAFVEAYREWRERKYGYEIALKSIVYKIFLKVIRADNQMGGAEDGCSETERIILRSAEYVNENYAEVNEQMAAVQANMSYSHYSRQFKRVMGRSFCEYLMQTKINAAERLLLTENMSVTDVALACGFATSSHFIDNFKKLKGITPKRYAQMWTENGEK